MPFQSSCAAVPAPGDSKRDLIWKQGPDERRKRTHRGKWATGRGSGKVRTGVRAEQQKPRRHRSVSCQPGQHQDSTREARTSQHGLIAGPRPNTGVGLSLTNLQMAQKITLLPCSTTSQKKVRDPMRMYKFTELEVKTHKRLCSPSLWWPCTGVSLVLMFLACFHSGDVVLS